MAKLYSQKLLDDSKEYDKLIVAYLQLLGKGVLVEKRHWIGWDRN